MSRVYELFNPSKKFGIRWWLNDELGFDFGSVSLYFDGLWYPRIPPDNYNLHTIFSNLKSSLAAPWYSNGATGVDFGEREFDARLYDNGVLQDIISIETTELTGITDGNCSYGCLVILLAFSGDIERLFYSFDLGNTYKELRLQRGDFRNVINNLPNLK